MAKVTKFNPVFQSMFSYVTENVSVDPNRPNGYKVSNKKQVRAACCHIMLKNVTKNGLAVEPKLMLEDDELAGTSHCLICDRTFEIPNITPDSLNTLKKAERIINGFLPLLPWSDAGKKDARLAIETRNLLEKFNVMYESCLQDISTARTSDVDMTIKSHASHL